MQGNLQFMKINDHSYYGNHSVERYELEHPGDERLEEAKAKIAELNAQDWSRLPGESEQQQIDRISDAYDAVSSVEDSAEHNIESLQQFQVDYEKKGEAKIAQKYRDSVVDPVSSQGLGAGQAQAQEMASFRKDIKEGRNQEYKTEMDDVAQQNGARQEYITNHLIAQDKEARMKEQGLNMERSAGDGPNDGNKAEDDRLARIYEAAGTPPEPETGKSLEQDQGRER